MNPNESSKTDKNKEKNALLDESDKSGNEEKLDKEGDKNSSDNKDEPTATEKNINTFERYQ